MRRTASFRTGARWKVVSSVGVYLLEDDPDGGGPATGYLPRLMLSASLPERLWGYPVPVRFGLCWLPFQAGNSSCS